MKILEVKSLAIPEVKVITYGRFPDHRGYFTETWHKSDFETHPELVFLHESRFGQSNESYSKVGTVRGLHLQFDPYMGKLVRTISGRMVDLAADVRVGSPTYGKIVAYDMPARRERDWAEWIWVPVGFAHGNFFPEETMIEYYCTGQYNPLGEVCISPLAGDMDWSLVDPEMACLFDKLARGSDLFTEKDRAGLSIGQWSTDPRSAMFEYARTRP